MSSSARTTLVFGAAGLIGQYLTTDLRRRGFRAIGIARRFPAHAQPDDIALPIMSLTAQELAELFQANRADVIVNCLGVLQDGPGSDTHDVHVAFVERLIDAVRQAGRDICLIQLSMPGHDADDHTPFSRTKREAERLIRASGVRHVILRPGFVIAPAAFGGSALMRALATLPFALGKREAGVPFAPVAIEDVAETVATIVDDSSIAGDAATWELMQREPATPGDVVACFRNVLGGPKPLVTLPSWLLAVGARLGDIASRLGWSPPIRTTALAEMRRGVQGDPTGWIAATGLAPRTLTDLAVRPATVQDKWFARLYLVKALIIVTLVIFWVVSGLIALTVSFDAAAAVLSSHGFPRTLVGPATAASSLMDIAIGIAIAFRRTCKAGLILGIAAVVVLHGWRHAAHPRPLARAARRAGEDVSGHRADAGRAAHAGQPMSDGRRGAWPDDGVILYDGVCVFCSRWVRFVAVRDVAAKFRFTAIQSDYGRRLAETFGIDATSPDTNAVVLNGDALFKSDAALAVISGLPHWGWALVLTLVPKPLRDAVYDLVARNRYRIFGTYTTCYLGDASFRSRVME